MRDLGMLYYQTMVAPTDPLAWAQLADHLDELGEDSAGPRLLAFAFDNWPCNIEKQQLTVRAVGAESCTGVAEGLGLSFWKGNAARWRWMRPGPNTGGLPQRFVDRDGVHWKAEAVSQWRWLPEWTIKVFDEAAQVVFEEHLESSYLHNARGQLRRVAEHANLSPGWYTLLVPPGAPASFGWMIDGGVWLPVNGPVSDQLPFGV